MPGLTVKPPAKAEFTQAGPRIVEILLENPCPSFWFIDPFGFRGVPLHLIGEILALPQSEAFITFMSRDINRFLDQPNHMQAIGELLGLTGEALEMVARAVMQAPKREHALRDLFVDRLQHAAGAKYVWPFRVAADSVQDTVYYLVHASNHPKAFREMKDATYEESNGTYAFLGADDYSRKAQLPLFTEDQGQLEVDLVNAFAGRSIEYEALLDEAYPDPRFHMFIEKHFRLALNELVRRDKIRKTPVTSRTARGLQGRDLLQFPPA